MPIYHFKCECGNEFERFINIEGGFYKWCRACENLTQWIVVEDKSSELCGEKVCVVCFMGAAPPEKTITQECPQCQKQADHILHYETHKRKGGSTVADSSLRFHFDYFEPTDN